MIVQSLLVINLMMAAPHQLLEEGSSDLPVEPEASPDIGQAVPPPPPGPYESTALQTMPVKPPARLPARPPVQLPAAVMEPDVRPESPSASAAPAMPQTVLPPRWRTPYPQQQQPAWQPLPPPVDDDDWSRLYPEPHTQGGYAQPSPWLPLDGPPDAGYGYGYDAYQYGGGTYYQDPYRPPAGYYPPPPPRWAPQYPAAPPSGQWPPSGELSAPVEPQPPVQQR